MSTAPASVHRRPAPGRSSRTLAALGALLFVAVVIAVLVDRVIFDNSSRSAGAGSGVEATQARSVPPFSALDLTGANNVTVNVGARQSVIVHGDNNLLGRVTTRVQAGSLLIGNTPGNFSAKAPMFVAVTVPSLDAITLTGSGDITVRGLNNQSLTVALVGAGNIRANGTTTRLDVTIGGAGNTMLGQLTARDANATVAGNGTISLTATHSLTASIPGTGAILYGGNPPHVTATATGSGTVTPG
jgi:hypothetical protein